MKLKNTKRLQTLVGLVSLAGTRADTIKNRFTATGRVIRSWKSPNKKVGSRTPASMSKWIGFDYSPSIDAFAAGKIDADMIVAG